MSSYALFDDAGKFLAGRLMSEADSSVQIELESGKRVKVKSANVLLRFAKPEPAVLIAAAQAAAAEIDLEMAWEFAPEGEFSFGDLARDYFSAQAGPEQQAAVLFKLFDAPHYFRRAGKGLFKKAPEETVKAALLGIERKAAQALQIEDWATELAAGRCPDAVREQLYRILFKPDKNGPEYKAVVEAAKRAQRAPLDLLQTAGAIASPYQFHWKRFLFEQFAKGTGFPVLAAPAVKDELPLAPVQAFSIDDSQTTEIDDALSVNGLETGTVVFGVHIAAPALAFGPDSPIDKLARERLSTVYMPGYKITMLPDEVVQGYTLTEGRDCPAVSLYVSYDEATLAVLSTETRIERVPIAANLRHDQLDEVITVAALTGEAVAEYRFAPELAFAFRLAKHLKAQREVVRGKPENFNRPDYNFRLDRDGADSVGEPRGDETVRISERKRGAPLDLIVSEAMILANSHWGGFIAEVGVPGIYRSQASMAPGVKVRMGTKPAPHAPRPHRSAGRAVQTQGRDAVLGDLVVRRRLHGLQRLPARHRALLDTALAAAKRGHRTRRRGAERRPGARRHAAAGVQGDGLRALAAQHPRAGAHHRHGLAHARPARQLAGPARRHVGPGRRRRRRQCR